MFGHDSLPSKIYSYGALPPSANTKLVSDQMFAAHLYRNKLVEEERERRQRVEVAVRQYFPDLDRVESQLAATEERREELRTALKKRYAVAKSRRKVEAPEKVEIAELTVIFNELTKRRKEMRKVAFSVPAPVAVARKALAKAVKAKKADTHTEQAALELAKADWKISKPDCAALSAAMEAIDTLSHEKCLDMRENCGVYWPTYLAVEQSMAKRRKGAPPQFKRFDGDGRLALQIQGGMTMDKAFKGKDNRLRVDPIPDVVWYTKGRSKLKRTVLHMRIGSDGRGPVWCTVPFIMHRPLPKGCLIKWVYLIRRRVATRYEWRVQFVVARAGGFSPPDLASGGEVAVEVGWRSLEHGLRVALWVGSDEKLDEFFIPTADVKRWKLVEDLQSIRSKWFEDVRSWLVAFVKGLPMPTSLQGRIDWVANDQKKLVSRVEDESGHAWRQAKSALEKSACGIAALSALKLSNVKAVLSAELREELKTLDKWRSPGRIAKLLATFPVGPMRTALEWWLRHHDEHLYVWQECQRKRCLRWRDDLYRNFAVMLRRSYKTIIVEDINWSELQETPEAEEASQDDGLLAYRSVASVGRLVQIMSECGADLVRKQPDFTTSRCWKCGSFEDFDHAAELVHRCSQCGEVWDQDENAARNLLKADWPVESARVRQP